MAIDFDVIVPQLAPDVQVETDWTGARNVRPVDAKTLLLLGYKTSAGSITAGVPQRIAGLADAIALTGKGSQLACMAERALQIAPRCPIYVCSYAEAGGGVQAHADIAITGPATSTGTLVAIIGGRRVQVGIASADSATTIGDNLVLAINGLANAPVTAANSAGTVTVTARNKGAAGNSIRMAASCTASGVGLTVASVLASGATEGDPTSTLAGIEGSRFHLVALGSGDATQATVLKTDREKQSTPAVKKWGIGIVGCNTTLSDATTLANTEASYRMQVVWSKNNQAPNFEMAAAFAAARCAKPANKSLDGVELTGIAPALSEADWPTAADIEAALAGGVTPLQPTREGRVLVVRSIITKVSGAAFIDHNPAEISDYVDETLVATFSARMMGRPLKTGSAPGTPSTVTPGRATQLLYEVLLGLDRLDYLQGVKSHQKAGLLVAEINATDPNRVDCAFPFWPIAQAHQIMIKKSYVTSA